MKFRKKPVVIDAEQWDGTFQDMERIKQIFPKLQTLASGYHKANNTVHHWKIGTLEGSHYVSPNDFVIQGVKGEYYPCKPDIFAQTYDPAE